MQLSESKNQNPKWGANLINSTVLAFAFTFLWANIIWYYAVSLDMGFDPLPRHDYRRSETHPIFLALLSFLVFWGSAYALHFCTRFFNIHPLLNPGLTLNTPQNYSTLLGWFLGPAVTFVLLCTRLQSMFETSF